MFQASILASVHVKELAPLSHSTGPVMPYPNDRLSGFAMATKTCLAAKLYQRLLNLMRSLSVLK